MQRCVLITTKKVRIWFRAKVPNFVLIIWRLSRNLFRYTIRRLTDHSAAGYYKKLIFEKFPELDLTTNLGLVLDIGANVGHFTCASRKLGFKVISIEPHPQAFKYLLKRFKYDTGVICKNEAISDITGKCELFFSDMHFNDPIATSIAASTIRSKFNYKNVISTEVDSTALKSYFANNERYSIVKIDIEGGELKIIDTLIQCYTQIDRLLLENHMRFMKVSPEATDYTKQIKKLEKFIIDKKLVSWHLDWI